jgi:hypothetical protein
MNRLGIIGAALAFSVLHIRAQGLEYRVSLIDEGTLNKVRLETPLNYQNKILPQSTSSNLGTANLFLGYGGLTTSLNFDASTENLKASDYTCTLHELSLDLSLTDEFDITIGKKILKWGPGYAFNPTGVVEPQRSPSDPSDRLGQNDGRKLISATAFLGKSSMTFVYINDVQYKSSKLFWSDQEFALRAYTLIDGFDLSLIGHYKEGDRLETGFNCAKVIGSNLELHGEFLAKKGSSAEYHQVITTDNVEQIFSSYPYEALYDRSNRIFYKILLGGQYTFENNINIILEYYHDAEGLSKIEWKRWMKFVKFQNSIQQGSIAVPPIVVEASRYNILWALRTLSPRGAMSDYLFARESYSTGKWSFECYQLLNALDFSMVVIPTVSFGISENVSLYSRWTSFVGVSDSEFGALFNSNSFSLGIRFQL